MSTEAQNPQLTTRLRWWLAFSLAAIAFSVVVAVHIHEADLRSQSHIINYSCRARVGVGVDVLVSGLVIKNHPQTILIRVLGPSLKGYGIKDALADPVVQVVHQGSGKEVGRNDNWQDARQPRLSADLSNHRPKDKLESVLLLRLEPGNYSVVVEGKNQTQGLALLEVYRVKD